MITPLPRPFDASPPRDLADLAARLVGWARQIEEYLRLTPVVETITFDVDPETLPVSVLVETPVVRGVARMKTVNTSDGALIDDTGIEWDASRDGDDPGVIVSALTGCASGTTYQITVAVIGERV